MPLTSNEKVTEKVIRKTGISVGGGGGVGGGDMMKAVYDTNNDGIVDNSEKLEGKTLAEVRDHDPKAHKASHEAGGDDEINVTDLKGELADEQKSNFLKLSDTPNSYSGQAGKVPKVKTTEDGLEFGDVSAVYARGFTKVVAASDSIDKTNADYICDGTDDQVEIQAAIDAVAAKGGTVKLLEGTYNISSSIVPKDNICLMGSGYGTCLKRVSNIPIISHGNADRNYIIISDIKFDGNSKGVTAIIDYYNNFAYHSIIKNCAFINCGKAISGFRFLEGKIYGNYVKATYSGTYTVFEQIDVDTIVSNNLIDAQVINVSGISCEAVCFIVDNIIILSNALGTSGIGINTLNATHTIIANNRIYYGKNGIYSKYGPSIISNNLIYRARREGIILENIYDGAVVIGNNLCGVCYDADNTYDAISIKDSNSKRIVVAGNIITPYSSSQRYRYGIAESVSGMRENLIIGNSIISPATAAVFLQSPTSQAKDNLGSNPSEEQVLVRMKNTSGSTIPAGAVVVLKSVAAGNEITTTTTAGDNKVFGMAVESINDGAFGYVQILGKTTLLKVNGIDDIAVGDFLSTYTEAGIAKKAASGEMAFAVALEAYSNDDSNGVLDALLITPRKV